MAYAGTRDAQSTNCLHSSFLAFPLLCRMYLTLVCVTTADYLQLHPSQVTDSKLIDVFSSGSKKPEVVKGVNGLFATAKLSEALTAYAGGVA